MSKTISPLDIEVASPPSDGITDLAFSSQADFLAVSSWDRQVRVYEVQPTGHTVPKALYEHQAPVLSVDWSKDGSKVVSGGADHAARMLDCATGQATQVAQHDAPIKSVKFLDQQQQILVTGSWDKTIKYWDLRTPQPVGTVQLPERCYSMDLAGPLLVVGTADKHVCIFDTNNPTVIFKKRVSPLKWQLRNVTCFPDSKGYAIGSVEGRVAFQYLDERDTSKNYTFKCHRDDPKRNVFAVNSIQFHPVHGTFATCGSDGVINFWDGVARQRLKGFPKLAETVPCIAFNRNGNLLAYVQSYDWSKGYKFANSTNGVFLHAVKEEDIKVKNKRR